MRLFDASQASRSACLRASAARSTAAGPMTRKASRVTWSPCEKDATGHDGQASRYRLRSMT